MKHWEKFELFVEALCRKALSCANMHNVEVHRMSSGMQGGRDVVACYVDHKGHRNNIYIECKYYRSRTVNSSELSQKAGQVKNHSVLPQHWVLLAPEYPLDNEAEETITRLRYKEFLDFDIHRWDSGEHVKAVKQIFDSCRDQDDIATILNSTEIWNNHADAVKLFSDALVNLKPHRKLQSKSITFLTHGLFQSGDTHPEYFFHGQPISWRLLSAPDDVRVDIPRTAASLLKELITQHNSSSSMPRLMLKVVTGLSGNGKTTLLRRLAYDLFHDGYAVWYLDRTTDDEAHEIHDFMMRTAPLIGNRPPVIIVDWLPGAEKCLQKIASALENQGMKAIGLAAGTDTDWGQIEERSFLGNFVRMEPAGITLFGALDRKEAEMLLCLFEKMVERPVTDRDTIIERLCQMPTILHAIAALTSQEYIGNPDETLRKWVCNDHRGLPESEQKAHAWVTLAAAHGAAISAPLLDSLIRCGNAAQIGDVPLFRINAERWTAGAVDSLEMCIINRDRHEWFGAHEGRSKSLWCAIHQEYEKTFLSDLASLQVVDRQDWLISAFFLGRALVRLGDGIAFQIGRKVLDCLADYVEDHPSRRRTALNSCLELGKAFIKKDKATAQKYLVRIIELEPDSLHAHLELGRLMVSKGNTDEAERLFKRYLEIDPNGVHAHLELGRLMVSKGNTDEAERLFKRYLEIDPNGVHAHLELGRLMVSKGNTDEAERLFKKCLEIDPQNIHAHLELGRLMVSKGNTDEAERLFKRYLEIDPNGVHAHLELGRLMVSKGNTDEAERLFKRYLEIDPNGVHAHLELGRLMVSKGNTDEAERLFKRYLEIDPNGVHAHLELGRLMVSKGNTDEAERLFKRYLEIDPNGVHAHLELGRLMVSKGNTDEAERLFKKCLEIDPQDIHAHLELGRLMVSKGNTDEAERLFKKCLEIDPQDIHAHLELGRLMVSKGNTDEAERLFKRYLEIDPNGVHAHLELGRLMVSKGNTDEAERLFKRYLEIDPNGVHAHLELGRLMVSKGNTDEAERLFKKCLEIDPQDIHAHLELGRLMVSKGNTDEAERLFKRYLEIDPNGVHAHLELGRLMVSKGNTDEAERLFKRYLEIDPNGVHAHLELGRLMVSKGNTDEAERLFKKCLEIDPQNIHAHLELGRLMVSKGNTDEAERLFKRYLEIDPNGVHAHLELGRLYIKFEQYKKAQDEFETCLHINKSDNSARLELIKLHLKQRNLSQAYFVGKDGVRYFPMDAHIAQALGLALLKDRNNIPLGLALLSYCYKLEPNDEKAYCILASKALWSKGALLRLLASTILQGPIGKLEKFDLNEVEEIITFASNITGVAGFEERFSGVISKRGFVPKDRRFFITPDRSFPKGDLCCFMDEWIGFLYPQAEMKVTFEIAQPINPLKGHNFRAVNVYPKEQMPYTIGSFPELPDNPL